MKRKEEGGLKKLATFRAPEVKTWPSMRLGPWTSRGFGVMMSTKRSKGTIKRTRMFILTAKRATLNSDSEMTRSKVMWAAMTVRASGATGAWVAFSKVIKPLNQMTVLIIGLVARQTSSLILGQEGCLIHEYARVSETFRMCVLSNL